MEQGTPSEAVVEGQQSSAAVQQERLATFRECHLLANYLNEKYGHSVRGRRVETPLARWSREQLEKSLKAA